VVLVAGALAMAAGGALYLLSSSVPGLVLARLVFGSGEGAVYTAGAAWAVDLAPPERRGLALGIFGLSVWGGLSLGPLLGELLRANSGYDAVWLLIAVLPFAGALVASRLPDPPSIAIGGRQAKSRLLTRAALRPGLALALANIGYAALAGFVVLHLNARGIRGRATVFTAFAVAVFASRLVLSRVPDRAGAARTAAAAGAIEAGGLAIIALATSLAAALAGAVVVGIGFSMLFPALALMVVGDVGDDRRGSTLGAFTAFFDIGVGLGGPIAGATASLAGYPAVFWLAAGAAVCTAVLAATRADRAPVDVAAGWSGLRP
jgi:MFS family permease